jgi:hypothetical protein
MDVMPYNTVICCSRGTTNCRSASASVVCFLESAEEERHCSSLFFSSSCILLRYPTMLVLAGV